MRRTVLFLASAALVVLLASGLALAAAGDTTRVSVSSSGEQTNSGSFFPSLSSNGRFVVFTSYATNLVANDTNGADDAFVRDRQAGSTQRVSVSSSGAQANGGDSIGIAISSYGRFVVFNSYASNLVPGDTNGADDAFVRDTQTGTTERVSVDSSGAQANSNSGGESISPDGRFVVFSSSATNLVPKDTNGVPDVFVRDRQTGITRRVNVSSSEEQANGKSFGSAISSDGRFVVFWSDASNLVPNDTNRKPDVFVRDRQTGTTRRVNVSSSEEQANGYIGSGDSTASMSSDGRFVVFDSLASNLVPNDTNDDVNCRGWDVFVRDRQAGTTERVSVSSSGAQANCNSGGESISPNGRVVAFNSTASNLVANDTNDYPDVFVHEN